MDSLKSNAVTERPIFDELFEGIHNANERLGALNIRLCRMNDKIFGPRPRPEDPPKTGQPTASGVSSSFRDEVGALHDQLEKTGQLLTQLERFV